MTDRITDAPLQKISPFLQGGPSYVISAYVGDNVYGSNYDVVLNPTIETKLNFLNLIGPSTLRVKLPSNVDGCVVIFQKYDNQGVATREVLISGTTSSLRLINNELLEITLPQINIGITIYGIAEDTRTLNVARIIDNLTKLSISTIRIWNPNRGLHTVDIQNIIDMYQPYDPAVYNTSYGQTDNQIAWNQFNVGKVWVDTSTFSYLPYNDVAVYPNVQDRLRYWGQLTQNSNVAVYEWVKSTVPPDQWTAISEAGTDENITGTAKTTTYRKSRTVKNAEFVGATAAKITWTFADTNVPTNLPVVDSVMTITIDGIEYNIQLPGELVGSFDEIYHVIQNQLDVADFTVSLTSEQLTIIFETNGYHTITVDGPLSQASGFISEDVYGGSYAKLQVFDLNTDDTIIFRSMQEILDEVTIGTSYRIVEYNTNQYDLYSQEDVLINVSQNTNVQLVQSFVDMSWARDTTLRLKLLAGFDLNTLIAPTIALTDDWINGDFVTVYVNGIPLLEPIQVVSNSITIPQSLTDVDIIELVKFEYIPTEDEIQQAEDIDDGSMLEIWTLGHDYTLNVIPSGNSSTPVYYFWVRGSTIRKRDSANLVELERQFSESNNPYIILQDLAGYDPESWQYQNTYTLPVQYKAVTLRKVNALITDNNRFKVQFTHDNTLRYMPEGLTGPLEKKESHQEWILFRQHQLSNIDKKLWDLMTNSMVGYDINNPSVRVPSLTLETYDDINGTSIRYGMGKDQALVDKQLGINTVLNYINDHNRDFYPIDIDSFRAQYPLNTPENVAAAMSIIYDSFGSTMVNEIWFELLMDALTTSPQLSDIFKTSWIALHGIRILDVGGRFDD